MVALCFRFTILAPNIGTREHMAPGMPVAFVTRALPIQGTARLARRGDAVQNMLGRNRTASKSADLLRVDQIPHSLTSSRHIGDVILRRHRPSAQRFSTIIGPGFGAFGPAIKESDTRRGDLNIGYVRQSGRRIDRIRRTRPYDYFERTPKTRNSAESDFGSLGQLSSNFNPEKSDTCDFPVAPGYLVVYITEPDWLGKNKNHRPGVGCPLA